MDTIWIELALIVVGVLLNGFFAASEIALVSSRVSRLTQLGPRSAAAAAALRLKQHPDTFLATIQIGITLVGTLTSAIGGATAVEALTPLLVEAGLGRAAQPAALAVVVVTITYLSLVLCELAPKALALRDPERLATLVARPILALSRVSAGLVRILTASTNVVSASSGPARSTSPRSCPRRTCAIWSGRARPRASSRRRRRSWSTTSSSSPTRRCAR